VGFGLDLGLQYLPGSLSADTHQLALIPHFEDNPEGKYNVLIILIMLKT